MNGSRYQKLGTAINRWTGKAKTWDQSERGLSLVESLIAVAILGVTAVALVVAMSTGMIAVRGMEEGVIAQNLVRTQLEYVKSCPYDSEATSYPDIDTPEGYAISVGVSSVPDTGSDIQKVTATVSREGVDILTVEDYKVSR